jgi:DNA-binding beta-propeller fold protein YncE
MNPTPRVIAFRRTIFIALGAVIFASAVRGQTPSSRLVPGLQADGATLLHNLWPIRPVGRQVPLGDFPVNLAVDPSGRYAAVLHAGRNAHQIRVIELDSGREVSRRAVHQAFYGLAFSADGRQLVASGGADDVLRVFDFHDGELTPVREVALAAPEMHSAVAGVALADDGQTGFASLLFVSRVAAVNLRTGATLWTASLDPPGATPTPRRDEGLPMDPKGLLDYRPLVQNSDPLGLVYDAVRQRLYASLWGSSEVAVLDARDGTVLARWAVRLHPNEMVLAPDGRRLFVANGGRNSVTVLDADTGETQETLSSAIASDDLPGSTPDSVALSRDGRCLFVANAYNNNVAVFDVSVERQGRVLGFIPTGWFPSSVRLTPAGDRLLVVSARGLTPKPNNLGETTTFTRIDSLYLGSLGIVDFPPLGIGDRLRAWLGRGDPWHRAAFAQALAPWTAAAERCHPAPVPPPPSPDNPVPAQRGGKTPIRYVIYVIKENRTYDQVLGDLPEGNGDPHLCLFPERVTPNVHKIARQFTLFDNFYANAERSEGGHEWSTAAYSSEFVEKIWPPFANHDETRLPYPAEGRYAAAVPALGYIWDRALACQLTYRDYGEFVVGGATPRDPATSAVPALAGHVDPYYHGWDLHYPDTARAERFIAELHRFEAEGDMPRLQILRLPNDHTEAARAGALSPRAMVAQNDLALGRLVEAVTHSRFWPQTAMFIVEDDAQNGPDHVDAHRTEALVVSPYTRRRFVDSTAYTTCSMLATMEYLLGMAPLSQFDDAAAPMRPSFQPTADLTPYAAESARVDLLERNPAGTPAAALSARMNFAREDANDDQLFNRVLWLSLRGDGAVPAPVHAAFVWPLPGGDDD